MVYRDLTAPANMITRGRPQRGASFGSQAAPLLVYSAGQRQFLSRQKNKIWTPVDKPHTRSLRLKIPVIPAQAGE
jgi:hypothetical protein